MCIFILGNIKSLNVIVNGKSNPMANWKTTISERVVIRNKRESEAYSSIISSHYKYYEQVASLKAQINQQKVELQLVRNNNNNQQLAVDSGNVGGGSKDLQHELYKLQKEIATLHRNKGEKTQQTLDLMQTLSEKDKTLQAMEAQLKANETKVAIQNEEMDLLRKQIDDSEQTKRTVLDEFESLKIALKSLEEKSRTAQDDRVQKEQEFKMLQQKYEKELKTMQEKCDEQMKALQQKYDEAKKDISRLVQEKLRHQYQNEPTLRPAPVHSSVQRMLSVPVHATSVNPGPAQLLGEFDAHVGSVNAIIWNPSGSFFATGGSDTKIKLWRLNRSSDCNCFSTLSGCNGGIMSIEFDMEKSLVLGASNDKTSRVWALADMRVRPGDTETMPVITLSGHKDKVLTAKFLGDSSKVVSGSHDRTLKTWDLNTGACSSTIVTTSTCNDLVTFGSSSLISGHYDQRLRFWDLRSGNTTHELGLDGKITSLALSPDRLSLLACTRDGALEVVDLRKNEVCKTLSADDFVVACNWSRAVYSPDGEYAAAGSKDDTLYIWNIKTGRLQHALRKHSQAVIACSWHPDGSYILSSEQQNKFAIWSM